MRSIIHQYIYRTWLVTEERIHEFSRLSVPASSRREGIAELGKRMGHSKKGAKQATDRLAASSHAFHPQPYVYAVH